MAARSVCCSGVRMTSGSVLRGIAARLLSMRLTRKHSGPAEGIATADAARSVKVTSPPERELDHLRRRRIEATTTRPSTSTHAARRLGGAGHGVEVVAPAAIGDGARIAPALDRLLAASRAAECLCSKRRRRSAAGGVRRSVPVRSFADWKEPLPGNMEADLVAHTAATSPRQLRAYPRPHGPLEGWSASP